MDETEILKRASASAFKVWHAMKILQARQGGAEVYVAANAALVELTGLSYPTVVYAKHELLLLKVVVNVSDGHYSFVKKVEPLYPEGVRKSSTVKAPPRAKSRVAKQRVKEQKPLNGLSHEDRREAVSRMCVMLGFPRTTRCVSFAMGKVTRLLKDGFTLAEIEAVVKYARAEYDRGDRFKKMLDLLWVLGAGNFGMLSAAMKTDGSGPRAKSTFERAPEDQAAADESYAQRIKRLGLD